MKVGGVKVFPMEYEEAFQTSLDYFNGDELAANVFLSKYALKDQQGNLLEDSPVKMHWRIANELARIEKDKFKKALTAAQIFALLDRFKYIVPQGGPMFGIGNDHQIISLSNCFLLDVPLDSYSSILQVDEQLVSISKRRGGVGIDLSNLRPAGTPTKNAAKTSTGISTWMERYSNSIREVGQSGRRGALMLTLSIHHPDILTFCTIKNDPTKVTGANISVRLTQEFLDAVNADKNYELRFPIEGPPVISKKISARQVWETIIDSAHSRAEPGLLMWDNVTKYTPADCYENYKSRGTNPCSEINLSPLDSCRLLCLNLFSYVKDPFTKKAEFDFELFKQHAKIAQRLMDDIVDLESEKIKKIIDKIETDPEPEEVKSRESGMWKRIKVLNDEGRRTGTGITALGDTMAALNIDYGSKKCIDTTEEIYRTLKLSCYESSVDMAEEIGPFKEWDHDKEKDNEFLLRIKEEDKDLWGRMKKAGRRNISLLTTAPTGSVSIMTQTTSGIEPLFQISYTRRKKINPNDKNVRIDFTDQNGDNWQEFTVYHEKVKRWMDVTGMKSLSDSPWRGCCAPDIDWINRVKMQAAAQRHICHAISSTVNLPENASKEMVAKIYKTAFESGCKGITVYRDNCRTGVLVNKEEKAHICKTSAPKRPNSLPAEVHHLVLKGHRYYVVVGILDNEAYEIFTASNHNSEGDIIIPKNIANGDVVKEGRGKYILHNGEESFSVTNGHSDPTADALARLVSTSLRHGVDISFVVDQLEKTKGEMTSFAKVLARTLKKYIKDGTKVTGAICGNCGGAELIRQEGCVSCRSCGWSKC